MSQTISTYDKITIQGICSEVFGITLSENALEASLEPDSVLTITGTKSETVYLCRLDSDTGTDAVSCPYVLFYLIDNKRLSLDTALTDAADIQAMLRPVTQTEKISLWWCHATSPDVSVPSAILGQIPSFPRTELTLDEGNSLLYGINRANLEDAFPILKDKFPTADLSVLLRLGSEELAWSFSCDFGPDGWSPLAGPETKINELFKFRQIDLNMQWQKGLPIAWMVSGELTIASYQLQAGYLHPHCIVRASLAPTNTTESSIKGFLETTLGMPAGATNLVAGVLTAVDLSVYADLVNQEIEFKVRNTREWNLIGDFLKVSNMELRIMLVQQRFAGVELYLNLLLPIGKGGSDVLIDLEAVYDKSEMTPLWHFQAEIDEGIAVGELIKGLAVKFGAAAAAVPEQMNGLFFENLFLSFDHQAGQTRFRFSGNVVYSGEDRDVYLHVDIGVEKTGAGAKWNIDFETYILYAGYKFAINFEKSSGTVLLASFTPDPENNSFRLAPFLEEVLPGEFDLLIPDDLNIGIKYAFVAFYFPEKPTTAAPAGTGTTASKPPVPSSVKVFGIELNLKGSLDFTQVPGIGPLLGKAAISLESMRVVGSSADIALATLAVIDGVLAGKSIPGLAGTQPVEPKAGNVAFPRSVYLSAKLILPGTEVRLAHAFGKNKAQPMRAGTAIAASATVTTSSATTTTTAAPARTPETGRARSVQRVGQQFGPFLMESIGLSVKGAKFGLKFTGGIAMGPMDIQLINFTVVSSLNEFSPEFDLDGLAIGYDKPPLTVAGLLLKYKDEKTEAGKRTKTLGFRGGISVGFKQVSVNALGAYNRVEIYQPVTTFHHSFHTFFLYGYLGAPLGGPPFFFVTGLALGVGFNMGLRIPPPEEFATFPLTAAALKPSGTALTVQDMKDMMVSLDRYMPIREGNFWFAAGIKFESFKFLSGFLMLTLEFGDELEIGVLGIIEAIIPMAAPNPVIRLSLGFAVRILPERGVVEARGSFLPATFIFHEDVKIQGGMAFLTVMKDQGDGKWEGARAGEFIFTLGGYSPLYRPKSYYPAVPALQLDWRVDNNLFLSASAYFALTPAAIMLGGRLHGHFGYSKSIVRVAVDFKLALDFILYYKPIRYYGQASAEFHLTGSIEVDMGLFTVDKSLELDAGAALTIWGPEFSGRARLKLHFIVSFSVDVEFGGDYQPPKPLPWSEFQDSLLPQPEKMLNWSIVKGIVQESGERVIPTVNPHEVKILLDCQAPVKTINGAVQETTNFGIKPMALTSNEFNSELQYKVLMGSEDKTADFTLTKNNNKNIPTAIWQAAAASGVIPDGNGTDLIPNAVCGFELSPEKGADPVGITVTANTITDTLYGTVENIVKPAYVSINPVENPSATLITAFHPA